MRYAILGGMGALLALQGCNMAPKEALPTVAVPTAYKEAGAWQVAAPADTQIPRDWWRVFNDPELDRLEPMVAANNADLAQAVARYDMARSLAGEAEAGLFPVLGIGGSLSQNRQSAHRPLRGATQPTYYGNNQIDVAGGYELDLWGKLRNTAVAGRASAQASAADLAAAQLSQQAELATDYMALRGLDAQSAVLQQAVEAYGKALQLTQNRFAGRIASGVDVARAQTQLDMAQTQWTDVQSRRAVMEHAIATLVGRLPSELSIPPVAQLLSPVAGPATLPSTLLQRRPDVAGAERRVAAANARVGVARAAFYPTLTLNAAYGTQDTGLNLLSLPLSFWSVGPGLSLPILEGGRLQARESYAYADLRAATSAYRGTVLNAFREVEDNLARQHWLALEAQQQKAAVADAQHLLDMAMAQYREQVSSYLEVVTAQAAALQAQQGLISVQARLLTANIGLIRALGGGWTEKDLPSTSQAAQLPEQRLPADEG